MAVAPGDGGGMDEQATDRYSAVLAEADAERAAAAMAIAATTYASVSLADRLRGSLGETITARTHSTEAAASGLTGRLAEVALEGFVLQTAPGKAHVVTWGGIESIAGLLAGHRTVDDSEPARGLTRILYPAAGCDLTLAPLSGQPQSGRLLRVGSDHVELRTGRGLLVAGFTAISWLTCPVGDQFESSGSGLSLR